MPRIVFLAALLLTPTLAISQPPTATSPPDTEIFLATLTSSTGGNPSLRRAANITNSPGYDNQPSFSPDGRSIFHLGARRHANRHLSIRHRLGADEPCHRDSRKRVLGNRDA
jgi:hypothetical protein